MSAADYVRLRSIQVTASRTKSIPDTDYDFLVDLIHKDQTNPNGYNSYLYILQTLQYVTAIPSAHEAALYQAIVPWLSMNKTAVDTRYETARCLLENLRDKRADPLVLHLADDPNPHLRKHIAQLIKRDHLSAPNPV